VGNKKVRFREHDSISLTAATRQMLNLDYNVQPTRYWTFGGKNLREIYNTTYEPLE